MRKGYILLLVLLFAGIQSLTAQRKISGTVTNSADNTPVWGATIQIKGTEVSVTTDASGNYSIKVPKKKNVIIVSFDDMKTQEIELGDANTVDIMLEPEPKKAESLTVTALNIPREKKVLGYALDEVKGENLQQDGTANVINSLSGRVAGAQVINSPGNLAGSTRILFRGINSISGNNQPLIIVDGIIIDNSNYNTLNTARGAGGYDYGNMGQDINPDNVASISVLKGANAAALYGSRAANGAIMITTKKGEKPEGKQIGIEFNTGLSFELAGDLPKYQNEYGGGLGGLDPSKWEIKTYPDNSGYYKIPGVDSHGNAYQSFDLGNDYSSDQSFGPKYTTTAAQFLRARGISVPAGSIYESQSIYYRPWNSFDSDDKDNYGQSIAWASPKHDVRDYFQTGVGWTNNIAFTGGGENSRFRLGLGSYNSSGYMPNSILDRYTVNLGATINLVKNIQVFTNINYISTAVKGRSETGIGGNNPMVQFNQWGQRQLDMDALKSYQYSDGSQRTWNRTSMDDGTPVYANNPYWDQKMNYESDQRNRYYGNVGVSWQITDWLSAVGKANLDNYTFRTQERAAIGSASESLYREDVHTNSELNLDFLFLVDKTFARSWRLTANFGGNLMDRNYKMNSGETVGGLLVPEVFSVNNALSSIADDYHYEKQINSLYGSGTLGWKNMLFLDLTLRNDWSSVLPSNNNSNLYPSAALSFVLTELPVIHKARWLSLAKIRGGWAKAGNDYDPYTNSFTRGNPANPNGYIYHFPPTEQYTVTPSLDNPNLRPEVTNSWEIGTELRFLKNRLGVDFTYYNKTSTDQILPASVSAASGFETQFINAGKITNKGIELGFTAVPIRIKKSFEWILNANFSKNNSQVADLMQGITSIPIGVGPYNISVNAVAGMEYGQLMGTNFIFDEDGNKVVDKDGRYLSSGVMALGSVLPAWNMGIGNEFKILGVDVKILFDIQHGGKFFSNTKMWGIYTGMLEETTQDNMREKGIIIDATAAKYVDGKVVYNADGTAQTVGQNIKVVDAQTWCTDHYNGPAAQNVLDASYIKLREVTISYTIPGRLTGPVKNLKVGIFGRNLATFGTAMVGIDPEQTTSSGNIQGIEGAGLPSARTFGFNIGFNF